eukprot:166209_1
MNHSIMTYLAVATVIIINTVNADEVENIFCENPWKQIPPEATGLNIIEHNIDQSQCEMTSDPQFNHGAIWWGSNRVPQYKFYNFEAHLEIEFPPEGGPVGGFLFRAPDISECG